MSIASIQRFITAPAAKTAKSTVIFWFSLSLTFAALYASLGLWEVFSRQYVIQDDARQHVFWMQRFVDPQIFANDMMADYFQSVAPAGYTAIYQVMAIVGIDPFLLNKLLPLVLGLVTTAYCFGVCMELLPVPFAGFIATLLLNQNLWMQDDIPSATPVGFAYPLFVAFLYYLLRRSQLGTGVAIALLGLFYPQCVFLCCGVLVLQLLRWENKHWRLSPNRQDYIFSAIGLGVALLVMLPYALKSSQFGPVLTAAQAKTIWPSFFISDPFEYWVCWRRTGFMPPEWCELDFTLPQIFLSLWLPVVLRFPFRFPLAKQVSGNIAVLPQLLLVSATMFLAAHALLFKLHLPNRYTEHSLRIVVAIAAGIAFTLMLDAVFQNFQISKLQRKSKMLLGFAGLVFTFLLIYPILVRDFPNVDYKVGKVPPLYEFLAKQPKDTLIASMTNETDNLPSFTKRSILIAPTYVLGYHVGYYTKMRDRAIDMVNAQYSPDLQQVQSFIKKYGVDLWLLERSAFTPAYLPKNHWVEKFRLSKGEPLDKAVSEANALLNQGTKPAITGLIDRCSVFQTGDFVVLQADCILKPTPPGNKFPG